MNHHDKNIAANVAANQDDRMAAAAAFKLGDRVQVRAPHQTNRERPELAGVVAGLHEWFGVRCVDVDFGGTVRRVVQERVRKER